MSPFYMFQVFSIILWALEPYYIYAGVIFGTSVVSVIFTLKETRENYARLREMSTLRGEVMVFRNVKTFLSVEDGQTSVDYQIDKEG